MFVIWWTVYSSSLWEWEIADTENLSVHVHRLTNRPKPGSFLSANNFLAVSSPINFAWNGTSSGTATEEPGG